jgi:hypothetical protein
MADNEKYTLEECQRVNFSGYKTTEITMERQGQPNL